MRSHYRKGDVVRIRVPADSNKPDSPMIVTRVRILKVNRHPTVTYEGIQLDRAEVNGKVVDALGQGRQCNIGNVPVMFCDGHVVFHENYEVINYNTSFDFHWNDEPFSIGDVMTVEKFEKAVKSGCFIDYDGFGFLATSRMESNLEIRPSTFNRDVIPSWATHVVWFNR